jgi:hypothetical protein
MNRDREQMWQAYVDGELSACEAAQFEASLTEADRARLAAEMRFERALSDQLREDCPCPEAAWQRARDAVKACEGPRTGTRSRRVILAGATLAAAAAIAFALSYVPGYLDTARYAKVIHAAESVQELAKESETDPGWESVQAYLDEHGIDLTLREREQLLGFLFHRRIELIGARQVAFGGGLVTELLIDCCGKPVKLIVAKKHSEAGRALLRAAGDDDTDIQGTRKVNGYIAAVVAIHPSNFLLNLVDGDAN